MELLKWAAAKFGQIGIELVRKGYTKAQILSLMVPHTTTGAMAYDDKWREQL
jgi:hypothetical protein